MITLTKLNKEPFTLNAVYIEKIEATPDTMIFLTNGKHYVVLEPVEEVKRIVTEFYQEIQLLK